MSTKIGIDISHYAGVVDWKLLTPEISIRDFIIAKATEGADYQDPMFLNYWANICANGFQPGAYHFLRFGSSSPKDQMDNFLTQMRRAGGWSNNSIIAIDVEKEEHANLVSSVTEECVEYLKDNAGVTPYIYTGKNFWNGHVRNTPEIVRQCPLWIPHYRAVEPLAQDLPRGWTAWTIWQCSEDARVPGIEGPVDDDMMKI